MQSSKKNSLFPIDKVITQIKKEVKKYETPSVTVISNEYKDAFHVLISCIISLRTKDEVTSKASYALFNRADSPEKISRLKVETIEKLIYPCGFYRNKALQIKEISKTIANDFNGKTPDTIEELLEFKGVGRKTANLVVTLGFNKPGICVDIHVHRICNRWGYVTTKKPDDTEMVLRDILPKKHWIPINDLLVTYGQNICKPVSPFCSICKVSEYCEKIGVEKSR